MNAKKALALLAALCMTAGLSACGGDTGNSTAETTTNTAAESTTTAPETTTAVTTTEAPKLDVDPNAITFDDGNLYFLQMGGGGDEADVELSIAEYNGDKKLKVHVLRDDPTADFGVPKLVLDLPAVLGLENVGNIGHISVDFTCVANEMWKNDDGTESLVVGNFLGALAGNIASEKGYDDAENLIQNTWANHLEFAFEDWENAEHTWRAETDIPALLPANGYAANDEGTTLVIMRWGQKNDVDFYIDNVTFYDKDGNSMKCNPVSGGAAKEGEEAPAETTTGTAAETTTAAAATTTAETTTAAAAE